MTVRLVTLESFRPFANSSMSDGSDSQLRAYTAAHRSTTSLESSRSNKAGTTGRPRPTKSWTESRLFGSVGRIAPIISSTRRSASCSLRGAGDGVGTTPLAGGVGIGVGDVPPPPQAAKTSAKKPRSKILRMPELHLPPVLVLNSSTRVKRCCNGGPTNGIDPS